MSERIEPALTHSEWLRLHTIRPGDAQAEAYIATPGPICIRHRWPYRLVVFGTTADKAALMALANAAQPDDSPYKITRADASLAALIAEEYPDLEPLAAKLAALLPSETP